MRDTESSLDETSLRRRLKRETAAAHRRLRGPIGLLNPGLDVRRYRRVLETFYGFYVPVEIDVRRLAAAEPPLGFPLRARAELIERNLMALGRSPAELAALPLCSDRPKLSCFEDLAGCTGTRRRVSWRTGPRPAVAPATRPRERQRCCVLRRRRGSGRCRGGPSSLPGSTDCRARAHQPQRPSAPRRRRSMRSRDGRQSLEGDCRGQSERM